ncbi:MAG: hypothetical protein R3180_00050 [Marinobacter sp.]|nr:hypothetical protein [Marinobacter sp.]
MITRRLNQLIAAYRIARQQLGDANRGKAIPAICMRRLSRLRPIILAEIQRVALLVQFIRRRQGWVRTPRYEIWDLDGYTFHQAGHQFEQWLQSLLTPELKRDEDA